MQAPEGPMGVAFYVVPSLAKPLIEIAPWECGSHPMTSVLESQWCHIQHSVNPLVGDSITNHNLIYFSGLFSLPKATYLGIKMIYVINVDTPFVATFS